MKTNPFNPFNNPSWRTIQTQMESDPIDAGWTSLFLVRLENEFLMDLDYILVPCMLIEFRTNKPSDAISTLVSIYDSKDLFVKELQLLLAQ
jgi:hypothetical protein